MRLEPNEKLIVVIRKHWLVFVLNAVLLLAVALMPLILLQLIPRDMANSIFATAQAASMAAFAYFGWLLALWILCFSFWTTYYLDMWVVTDRRIVNIDQKTLFRREMITARIEKIQDITVEVNGVLQSVLGYGIMVIYTAGENPDFRIENAAHPLRAKEKILAAHMEAAERMQSQKDTI